MQIKSPIIKNFIFIFLGLFLFAIDRIFKYLSLNNFFYDNIIGLKNILYFDFFKNENIAFSIPVGNNFALFVSVIILFSFLIFYILKSKKENFFIFSSSFLLIFIGTISNIIDRIKFGYVIDYINILNINICNLSDLFIIIGFIIFSFKEIKWFQK